MPEFDRWWNDLKKHEKRWSYWLPIAREVHNTLRTVRSLRYFTLCARSAIDVFMLAKEELLSYNIDVGAVDYVRFCESDADQFPEIGELIGVEGSGFFGSLEEIVLFEDDAESMSLDTEDAITETLESEGEGLASEIRARLQTKRTYLQMALSFPYDFVNLDFCGYYYPAPPDMLRINRTVNQILAWQAASRGRDESLSLDQFILSVTCRYDADFPEEARKRLEDLVIGNCEEHAEYHDQLGTSRGLEDPREWPARDGTDFFLSAWPKEIARLAEQHGWDMEVRAYVHYDRAGESGMPYKIACLVAMFRPTRDGAAYLQAALRALDPEGRKLIPEIDRASERGQALLQHLGDIVEFRNRQADRKGRPTLPEP